MPCEEGFRGEAPTPKEVVLATYMLAAVSDLHAGSVTAVCPPRPIELDSGSHYIPNKVQKWLYKQWEHSWGEFFPRMLDLYKPDKVELLLNGDMQDGDHHGSHEIISNLEGIHYRIAHELLEAGPMKHEFDGIHVVRGTPAHVGKGGGMEEGLARTLKKQHGYPIIDDPDTVTASSTVRRIKRGGQLIDCRHHGRMGKREHTKDSYIRLYAHDIWETHVRSGDRPPDLAIRAHNHRYIDSGRIHDLATRVVGLPCWQMPTEWIHRVAIESLPDIGMCVFIIRDGRVLEPEPMLYKPNRPTVIGGSV